MTMNQVPPYKPDLTPFNANLARHSKEDTTGKTNRNCTIHGINVDLCEELRCSFTPGVFLFQRAG